MECFHSTPQMIDDEADQGLQAPSVIVNNSLNRHWSIAFVSVELEIPPITRPMTYNPHVSLEGDFER